MAGVLRRALVPAVQQLKTSFSQPTSVRAVQVMSTHVGTGSGGRCGGWAVRSPPNDIPYAVKGLRHIAIVVPDLSVAAEHYRSVFGAQVSDPVEYLEHKVTKIFVQLPNVCIELLHPLGKDSPVAEFLRNNPSGGLHHVSLAVDDLHSAAGYLGEVGVNGWGGGLPKPSLEKNPAMFLHPKDNMGVLIELQQANIYRTRDEQPSAVGM